MSREVVSTAEKPWPLGYKASNNITVITIDIILEEKSPLSTINVFIIKIVSSKFAVLNGCFLCH